MSRRRWVVVVAALVVLDGGGCDKTPRASAPPASPAPTWLKGQLHAHTDNSGDGRTAPAEVARWYAARGYDFIVFTDHNVVTPGLRSGELLALPGVELTQNLETCEPPPAAGQHCLLHVNALIVDAGHDAEVTLPADTTAREAIYGASVEWARAHGAVAQLNHPNFHYAADAATIARLARRGLVLLEIANEAWDSENAGDATHPSTEALWDAVLSEGVTVYATATDDAHHYDDADAVRAAGGHPFTGDHGFVMVHAAKDPSSIREALRRGDFYASTGVLLDSAAVEGNDLVIRVADTGSGPYQLTFIGQGGRVLHTATGTTARFPLADAPPGYLRAVIRDSRGRKAWVQPVPTRGRS